MSKEEYIKKRVGNLTAILVENKKIGGYTSYYSEHPNVVTEGKTIEEALENLDGLYKHVLEYREVEKVFHSKIKFLNEIKSHITQFVFEYNGSHYYTQIAAGRWLNPTKIEKL